MIENHTIPVEDQLILTADRVGVGEHHSVFPRPGCQHLLTHPALAQMKRRSINVHDDFGAGCCLETGRTFRQPDILTNVDPNHRAAQTDERQPPAWMKIAAFVEHPVVRQVPLAVGRDELLICNDRRRIVEFVRAGLHHRRACRFWIYSIALADVAHHRGKPSTVADDFLKSAAVVRDKTWL